jgi:hypothetical protein
VNTLERIRESFNRQGFMRTVGAVLESVESGTVTISCGFTESLTQTRARVLARMTATMMAVPTSSEGAG